MSHSCDLLQLFFIRRCPSSLNYFRFFSFFFFKNYKAKCYHCWFWEALGYTNYKLWKLWHYYPKASCTGPTKQKKTKFYRKKVLSLLPYKMHSEDVHDTSIKIVNSCMAILSGVQTVGLLQNGHIVKMYYILENPLIYSHTYLNKY